jgi:hypothetical protein
MTEEWKKLHNEEFHTLCFVSCIVLMITSRRVQLGRL